MFYTSFQCLHTLTDHADSADSITISSDSQTLFSSYWFESIKVWSLANGQLQRVWEHPTNTAAMAISVSADGKTLISSGGGKVYLWDISNRELCLELANPHPNYTWDPATKKLYLDAHHPDNGLQGWTKSLAISSKTGLVYANTTQNNLYCWDGHTGEYLSVLSYDRENGVSQFALSQDGQFLVGIGVMTLNAWELSAEGNRCRFRIDTEHGLRSIALSSDSQTIAVSGSDGKIYLHNAQNAGLLGSLAGHAKFAASLAFSPDGQVLASGGKDRQIKLWEVKSGRELITLSGHTEKVLHLAFSPDGQRLVSSSLDTTIKIWGIA